MVLRKEFLPSLLKLKLRIFNHIERIFMFVCGNKGLKQHENRKEKRKKNLVDIHDDT